MTALSVVFRTLHNSGTGFMRIPFLLQSLYGAGFGKLFVGERVAMNASGKIAGTPRKAIMHRLLLPVSFLLRFGRRPQLRGSRNRNGWGRTGGVRHPITFLRFSRI